MADLWGREEEIQEKRRSSLNHVQNLCLGLEDNEKKEQEEELSRGDPAEGKMKTERGKRFSRGRGTGRKTPGGGSAFRPTPVAAGEKGTRMLEEKHGARKRRKKELKGAFPMKGENCPPGRWENNGGYEISKTKPGSRSIFRKGKNHYPNGKDASVP